MPKDLPKTPMRNESGLVVGFNKAPKRAPSPPSVAPAANGNGNGNGAAANGNGGALKLGALLGGLGGSAKVFLNKGKAAEPEEEVVEEVEEEVVEEEAELAEAQPAKGGFGNLLGMLKRK